MAPVAQQPAMEELSAWDRRALPGWIFSLGLHFALFTTLGLTMQSAPQGAAEEASREGGIVLVRREAGGARYFAEDSGDSAPGGNAFSASAAPRAPSPVETFDPSKLGGPMLPVPAAAIGSGNPTGASVPGAGSFTGNGAGNKGGPVGKGRGSEIETQVFGVTGRGSRFVYVFDRSASMSGYEGRPLAAAKRELVASLQSLQSVHQFQIIFYNENAQLMPLFRGQTPGLVFSDDQGKKLAEQFVGSVFADGGTAHMQALSLALKLSPDVIFFLTDADEPKMRRDELDRVRRLNQGTVINAIEFGAGPAGVGGNFLKQLAEENDGRHAYVDVTRLPR